MKYKYTGNLEFYYETGFEHNAIILHDNRGLKKSPGFNNVTKKWDGPIETFKSIEWAVFLRGGEFITVWNPENKIVYKGFISKDRLKLAEHNYVYGFLPEEIDANDWLLWCQNQYKAEIETNEPVYAEDEEMKKRFEKNYEQQSK